MRKKFNSRQTNVISFQALESPAAKTTSKFAFYGRPKKGVIIKVLLALLSPVLDALYCIMWNGASGIVFKVCCIKADTLCTKAVAVLEDF